MNASRENVSAPGSAMASRIVDEVHETAQTFKRTRPAAEVRSWQALWSLTAILLGARDVALGLDQHGRPLV